MVAGSADNGVRVASLVKSQAWERFIKNARRDAARVAKLPLGGVSSWAASQHTAPWFQAVRSFRDLAQEDRMRARKAAQKRGGGMVEAMLLQVWDIHDFRVEMERSAGEYYWQSSGISRVEERHQESGIFVMITFALMAIPVAFGIGRLFGFGYCCIFLTWLAMVRSLDIYTKYGKLGDIASTMSSIDKELERAPKEKSRASEREATKEKLTTRRKLLQKERNKLMKTKKLAPCSLRSEQVESAGESIGETAHQELIVEDDCQQEDDSGLCICCSENEALFVVDHCGHVAFCRTCRRKAVYSALVIAGHTDLDRRELGTRELLRTAVRCPLCRGTGLLIAKDSYEGVMFEA